MQGASPPPPPRRFDVAGSLDVNWSRYIIARYQRVIVLIDTFGSIQVQTSKYPATEHYYEGVYCPEINSVALDCIRKL